MRPIFTIIIPVYNAEKYLNQCLLSAISQSLTNLEIICVDDGSEDSSVSIIKEFSRSDSRVKLICQKNSGPGSARNNALLKARGKYIVFLDADDWLELNLCQDAYNIMERTGADIWAYPMFLEGFPAKFHIHTDRIKPTRYETLAERLVLWKLYWPPVWNKIYRRTYILNNSLFFMEGFLFEDVPYSLKSFLLTNHIVASTHPYYHYRYNSGYSTNPLFNTNWLKFIDTVNAMIKDFQRCCYMREIIEFCFIYKFKKTFNIYHDFDFNQLEKKMFIDHVRQNKLPEEQSVLDNDRNNISDQVRNFMLSVYQSETSL